MQVEGEEFVSAWETSCCRKDGIPKSGHVGGQKLRLYSATDLVQRVAVGVDRMMAPRLSVP